MKYGYLKRCLCITVAAALIGTSNVSLLAEDLLTSGVEGEYYEGGDGDLSDGSDESYEDEDYEDEDEDYEDEDEGDEDDGEDDEDDEDDEDGDDDVKPTPVPGQIIEMDPVVEPGSTEDSGTVVLPDSEEDPATVVESDPTETPEPTVGPEPTTAPDPTPLPEPIVDPGTPIDSDTDGELEDPEEPGDASEEEPTLEPEEEDEDDDEEEPSDSEETDDPEDEGEPEIEDPDGEGNGEVDPGSDSGKVDSIISRIDSLIGIEITPDNRELIESIRADYDSLSDEDKERIGNFAAFLEIEEQLEGLDDDDEEGDGDLDLEVDDSEISAITGSPVYYTNMVSNLHAGKDFYLNSLKENYQLTFSEDFAQIMEDIENDYKKANGLEDKSDKEHSLTRTSGDTLLVRNWQDILAIYVYEEDKRITDAAEKNRGFKLDKDSKEKLAEIFAEMNPVTQSKVNINRKAYGDYHIDYYIKKNNISKDDREILKKYVETDCKLLCAVVTAAPGFVRESVGEDVSEERVNVLCAAYSLVGKVGYFWGGKSVELGDDPSWGEAEVVTADGSASTGTTRAYGLDCSGFVTWAVVNGYMDQQMQDDIGDGTTEQWLNANVVTEADAQPGDLVFQKGPESGQNNHVGILCGKTDAGDWIAVHCSSGKNGVTVGEAYGASFRYIRQPDFYPTEEEVAEMLSVDISDGEEEVITDAAEENIDGKIDSIVSLDGLDELGGDTDEVLDNGSSEEDDITPGGNETSWSYPSNDYTKPEDIAFGEPEDITVEEPEDIPEEEPEPQILIDDSVVELF